MKNKKLVTIIVLVFVVSGIGIYFYTKSLSDDSSEGNNNQQNTESQEDKVTERPLDETPDVADLPKPENAAPTREESFEYNENIINPNIVAADPNPYIDKEITVRGWVVDTGGDFYSILSVNTDELNGLIASKEQSVDLSGYVDPSPNPEKQSTPVNLTGTLSNNGENGTLVFVVSSVNL